ncbi:hypothetical protein B0T10DRAFT_601251 [Thelonectria olida]|uniref:GPI anchored serine-threonine rich protein n=1 Tax=Thelonectria olida TaxID=1576542 RepID=A0A9P8WFW5_9HYPO|nr:hypothetical protein B0T10DRAFT_601251 [Thelonectria olida]
MNKFILLTLSATGAFAALNNAFLAERTVYQVPCADQGKKDCGSGCIDASWTCCPDGAGGCPADESCSMGTNGEYGCCPDGETCAGEGGAITNAHTSTVLVPGGEETSAVYGVSTVPSQGYGNPPADTSTAPVETPSVPVEETTPGSPEQPPIISTSAGYGNNATVPAQTTPAQTTPARTTPAQTTPAQTTPAATPPIVNGAASYGINVVGGLLAGVAALLV